MKKLIYVLLLAVLVLLAIGFAGFNSGQIVSVKFLGLRLENEFWIFSIIFTLMGVLFGYLLAAVSLIKYRFRAKSLDKKLVKAQKKALHSSTSITTVEEK